MIGFLPGVDIKAHENNYVLVAPSATDKGQYEWDLEKSKEGGTMVTPSKDLIQSIKKQYGETHGYKYDGKDGLRDLVRRSHTRDRTQTTDLFETIALGFGDEGGRNDKLAKFVGGLLYRAVDDGVVVQLARLANANSPNPLPEKEMMRTIESMIKKRQEVIVIGNVVSIDSQPKMITTAKGDIKANSPSNVLMSFKADDQLSIYLKHNDFS